MEPLTETMSAIQMKKVLWMVALFLAASFTEAEDALPRTFNEGAQQNDSASLEMDVKKMNLPPNSYEIRLGPLKQTNIRARARQSLSAERFLEAVLRIREETPLEQEETTGSWTKAKTKYHEVEIDTKTGEHHISLREDAEGSLDTGKPVSENQILRAVGVLCKTLGVTKEEARVTVKPLVSAMMEVNNQKFIETKKEGFLVFVDREIDGIPVPADRIALLAALDGTIRQMDGRWTPINYSDGQYETTLSRESVVERAIETLRKSDLEAPKHKLLRVSTNYEVIERDSGDFVLRLSGSIAVPADINGDLIEYNYFSLQ